jgi:hypothetical protein
LTNKFANVLSAAAAALVALGIAATQTVAAPNPNLQQKCRKAANDAVGGDTYRQGKRAGAVYRSCMASGGKV